jgi:hypothetical protein
LSFSWEKRATCREQAASHQKSPAMYQHGGPVLRNQEINGEINGEIDGGNDE